MGDRLLIVRSPQEQEDFLKHGRFGEGSPSQIRTAFSKSVIIGSAMIILGFLFIGTAVIFKIGRDDGGPLFMMGFFASLIIGLGCFLWALTRKIVKTFRH